MNSKKVKLLKIFLIINTILILLLLLASFYGKNIAKYDEKTINGVDNKINFFELIDVMYFADEDGYSKASKEILKQDKATYENYMLTTTVEIGVPALIEDYGVRDSKITMTIHSRIDGNTSMGVIDIESIDEFARYQYYRELKDNKFTTYLNDNGSWYKKEEVTNNDFGIKHRIEELKEISYRQFPTLKIHGTRKGTLYPANSDIREVELCNCGHVFELLTYSLYPNEIGDLIEKAMSTGYDKQAKEISDWMEKSDYVCSVEYYVNGIDHANVSMPENVKNEAIDGEIYDVIIDKLVNMTQTKL